MCGPNEYFTFLTRTLFVLRVRVDPQAIVVSMTRSSLLCVYIYRRNTEVYRFVVTCETDARLHIPARDSAWAGERVRVKERERKNYRGNELKKFYWFKRLSLSEMTCRWNLGLFKLNMPERVDKLIWLMSIFHRTNRQKKRAPAYLLRENERVH
jgi:hypothetical protein